MNTLNGMKAIRLRTVIALKVVAIAAVLSFAGPLVGNTATASAQWIPWPERVIQIGPVRFCMFICWTPGYCCHWVSQL